MAVGFVVVLVFLRVRLLKILLKFAGPVCLGERTRGREEGGAEGKTTRGCGEKRTEKEDTAKLRLALLSEGRVNMVCSTYAWPL